VQYLGIDWGTRRASWCAIDAHGALREGALPADQDGLARLALTLDGDEVCGCIEMMSGAVWVRDRLATVGWDIRLADARKVKGDRAVGVQDRPRRRARARRSGASRPDRGGVGALARGARQPRTPAASRAPDPAAHLGDEPHPSGC
jgi:hypothetical protein